VIQALRTFGLRLGTAYQIYDDVVDLAGDEARAGKTLGSDLRKGKLTLPILYLLQNAEPADRQKICDIILSGGEEEVATLVRKAVDTGALKNAVATGRRMMVWAGRGAAARGIAAAPAPRSNRTRTLV
jgi:octaprenyl-diphosphate synthase